MNDWRKPIHSGEILADELNEIELNPSQLAQKIDVNENDIIQIIQGQQIITADIALRLGKFFNTGAELWMNLQKTYELDIAREQLGNCLDTIIPYQLPHSTK